MVPQVKAPKNFSQWTFKRSVRNSHKGLPQVNKVFIGSTTNANKENKKLSFHIIYFLNVLNSNIF